MQAVDRITMLTLNESAETVIHKTVEIASEVQIFARLVTAESSSIKMHVC